MDGFAGLKISNLHECDLVKCRDTSSCLFYSLFFSPSLRASCSGSLALTRISRKESPGDTGSALAGMYVHMCCALLSAAGPCRGQALTVSHNDSSRWGQ